jgi:hypothetical protein
LTSDTTPHPSGNEDPTPGTATEGGNEPLSDAEMSVIDKLLQDVDLGALGIRVSKHRKGRTSPLSRKQRAKVERARARMIQASKSATEDAKVLRGQ